MLVISRKKDQAFVITDNIWVRVIEVSGDRVKLGITAPTEIPICREEVYVRNIQQKEEAGEALDHPPEGHVPAAQACAD